MRHYNYRGLGTAKSRWKVAMKFHGGISSLDLFFSIIVLKKEIKIASGCRISQFWEMQLWGLYVDLFISNWKNTPHLSFHSLGNLREQIPRRHAASKKKLKTNKWKKKLRFSTSLIRQLIVPALNFSLLWRFPVGEHCHKNSWNWRSNMTNVLGHEFCFSLSQTD